MKKLKLLSIASSFILVNACSHKDVQHLNVFSVFIGTWQQTSTNTIESWENQGTFLSGQVLKIKDADTLLVESLRLFRMNDTLYYEATVALQNEGKPVCFALTKQKGNEFQFENKNHDFPKKIIYTFLGDKKLRATIRGGSKQHSFNYVKINQKP